MNTFLQANKEYARKNLNSRLHTYDVFLTLLTFLDTVSIQKIKRNTKEQNLHIRQGNGWEFLSFLRAYLFGVKKKDQEMIWNKQSSGVI